MERLTKNDLNRVCYDPWEICGMDKYCTKGCHEEGGCTRGCHILKAYRKLADYEDKAEQGLLFSVLCKIGDTIYKIPSDVNFKLNVLSDMHNLNRVYEQKVNRIEVCDDEGRILYITCEGMDCVLSTFYKETWFLTREEAEEALAKMKGECKS